MENTTCVCQCIDDDHYMYANTACSDLLQRVRQKALDYLGSGQAMEEMDTGEADNTARFSKGSTGRENRDHA